MNKKLWHGRPLYVALAQRKSVRERQLKEEMDARMAQQSGLHRLGIPAPFGMPMMGQMGAGPGYMQNPAMAYGGPNPMMGPRGAMPYGGGGPGYPAGPGGRMQRGGRGGGGGRG